MSTATKEPTRLKHLATSVRDLVTIDPKIIVVEDGHNPRNYNLPENRAHLDELKASIKVNGVLVPLLVRWGGDDKCAILVDGECRLKACLELIEEGAEIVGVPVVQVKGENEIQRLILALTANTGKPLSKWEIGAAFQRLMNFGLSEDMIAQKLGYSLRYVKEAMELSDAPEDIKSLLSQQAVTPSLALSEIRKQGPKGATITLRAAVAALPAQKNGKHPVAAKRQKKAAGCSLSAEDAQIVVEALALAAVQKDEKLSDHAEKSLAIFAEKGIKPE